MPNSEEDSQSSCFKIWNKLDKKYLEPWFGKEIEKEKTNSWKKVWEEDEIEINELDTK